MAFIRNTNPIVWSPTGTWSARVTHCELLDGSQLLIRRPIVMVDEGGNVVTTAPDVTKSVIIPTGAAAAGINLSSPEGDFDRDGWKDIIEAYWKGKSINVRLLSAASGTIITGGGYADQAVAAWTVVR